MVGFWDAGSARGIERLLKAANGPLESRAIAIRYVVEVMSCEEEIHDGPWIILGIDLHAFPRAEGAKNVVEDPAVTSSADAKNHVDVDW